MELPVLLDKISTRDARIAILGLGYVGLTLAIAASKAGFTVSGYDVNTSKISELKDGASYVTDVTDEDLRWALADRRFIPHADFGNLAENDVFIVCVQTNVDPHNVPDFRPLQSACCEISQAFKGNQIVILESTIFPGVLEESVIPSLSKHGHKVGKDFLTAVSPERIDPGNREYPLTKIPKLVGGYTAASREAAVAFYETFIETVIPVKNDKVALLSKLLENTYRAVNIALVNELMMIADKLDVGIWDVVDAASTKPFGFTSFTPGPGAGGSCIPVDPLFLVWKIEELAEHSEFIELATKVNEKVPRFLVDRVTSALNDHGFTLKNSKILVIGVAYKPDVADLSHSPAFPVLESLSEAGVKLSYCDPLIPRFSFDGHTLTSQDLNRELVKSMDLVLILTNHGSVDYEIIRENSKLIFDSRNQYAGIEDDRIYRF